MQCVVLIQVADPLSQAEVIGIALGLLAGVAVIIGFTVLLIHAVKMARRSKGM